MIAFLLDSRPECPETIQVVDRRLPDLEVNYAVPVVLHDVPGDKIRLKDGRTIVVPRDEINLPGGQRLIRTAVSFHRPNGCLKRVSAEKLIKLLEGKYQKLTGTAIVWLRVA